MLMNLHDFGTKFSKSNIWFILYLQYSSIQNSQMWLAATALDSEALYGIYVKPKVRSK